MPAGDEAGDEAGEEADEADDDEFLRPRDPGFMTLGRVGDKTPCIAKALLPCMGLPTWASLHGLP